MSNVLCSLSNIAKSFGPVRALQTVSLAIDAGQCWGLVGHNGAGKSTLMNVLAGVFAPDQGQILIDGVALPAYTPQLAYRHGVRCVFQELSLCLNLSVAENLCVFHPALRGWGWRKRARALIAAQLDEIFGEHGIDADRSVGELTLTQRQMVEIACAFTVVDQPLRLLILDEPTSSLDAVTARKLTGFIQRRLQAGLSVVFISHMLGEIFDCCTDIAVMRDGQLVLQQVAAKLDRAALVQAMGHADQDKIESAASSATRQACGTSAAIAAGLLLDVAMPGSPVPHLRIPRGQVIGLSGLAGQGQTEMLVKLFTEHRAAIRTAFVAGDRVKDGNFPLWSIADNLSLRSLPALTKAGIRRWLGVIDRDREAALAKDWHQRVDIRTQDMHNNILSLSGGNQQKVLFARALSSDAELILMDDPMRGVDFATKVDMYRLIRAEAAQGRTFIWYTTENDELAYCDKTYVFYQQQITLDIARDDLSEERVIAASFGALA